VCETAGKKHSNNTDWQFWQQDNKPRSTNIVQKILASKNWQSFVRKVYFDELARYKDCQRKFAALQSCAK
jgi:hypothetical protein